MAKAIGLIGNFKGKVGNMVGYQIPDSNTGNTQGIRIYQPVVKNPKTSAQAEQRAKLAPINATYRALKSIIDRGNEGLPYGNKSRLAWLKGAFKAENMPWIEKGKTIGFPVGCILTKGSLSGLEFQVGGEKLIVMAAGVTSESDVTTIGKVSTLLKTAYPALHDGDQVTFVNVFSEQGVLGSEFFSLIINTTSTEQTTLIEASAGQLELVSVHPSIAGSVIISREGESGGHLRSSSFLVIDPDTLEDAPYNETSKTAAIASYMASAAGSTDWAEESIQ